MNLLELEPTEITPSTFIKEALGVSLWSKQEEIVSSVFSNRRTVVKSGHGVGKSFTVACIVLAWLYLKPYSKVITTANTYKQVLNVIWGTIAQLHRSAALELGGALTQTRLDLDDNWFAVGMSVDKPESFQGIHASGGVLVIFDEAISIPKPIWEAADTLTAGNNCSFLSIANPTVASGPFWDACQNPRWKLISISCMDHPNVISGKELIPGSVTKEWVIAREEEYGNESAYYQSRVLGEFPSISTTNLIPRSLIENAKSTSNNGYRCGIDIARYGDDSSVAAIFHNGILIDLVKWSETNLMTTCGKIIEIINKYKIPHNSVFIDSIGVGGGVVDRLIEQNYDIVPVNVASKPSDNKFLNLKAELFWKTKQALLDNKLQIDSCYNEVISDLVAHTYELDSSGKIKIESKQSVKKKLSRSPDAGDAVILAMMENTEPSILWI